MYCIGLWDVRKVVLSLDGTALYDPTVPSKVLTTNGEIVISCEQAATLAEELQRALSACRTDPLPQDQADVLLAELKEKLPSRMIHVYPDDCRATYYDYYGVSYRSSRAEMEVVRQYLADVVSGLLGHQVKITKHGSAGNGHDWCEYSVVSEGSHGDL